MIILAIAAGALALGVAIAMIILAGRQSHERPGYLPDSAYLGHGYNDLAARATSSPAAGSSRVRAESGAHLPVVVDESVPAGRVQLRDGERVVAEFDFGGDAA